MSYQLINGIKVWGEPLQNAVDQMVNCARDPRVVDCAMMADHHLGYAVPIGGVIAYDGCVSPSGVGYDIACGNKAVRLDVRRDELDNLPAIMDDIARTISFGVGRKNTEEEVFCRIFDSPDFVETWLELPTGLKDKARQQLGTVGSGNHYVDIFRDENDSIWIGVHFGSRGLGHTIATHFIKKGDGKDGINVDPVVLPLSEYLGQAYEVAMKMAGEYAYAGRDWVCARVAKLIGASIVDEVHNHHNFAWPEVHDGRLLTVVRKGATPAFPEQRSFIGGTMADPAVIVRGLDSEESRLTMHSTVHGAGRIMSRTEAAGKFKGWGDKRVRKSEGKVSDAMMKERVDAAKVELRGGGVDESPHCYKRLPEVLAAQGATIIVETKLIPIGVVMAGADIVDPYKD